MGSGLDVGQDRAYSVVPVSPPLLHVVYDTYTDLVGQIGEGSPLLVMFADWLDLDVAGDAGGIFERAQVPEGRLPSYRDVAVLGLGLASGHTGEEAFSTGVEWLRGRRFFVPGRTPGFEADGLAILGVAVGLAVHGTDQQRSWMTELVEKSLDTAGPGWHRSLLRAAHLVLGETGPPPEAADLMAALAAKGLVSAVDEAEARLRCVDLADVSPDVAVFRLAALRWLLRQEAAADLRHPTVDDLVRVLEGVPHALKRWRWESKKSSPKATAQKWDIQNEYHVQSLLWAVLAPIFRDLVDEEYLPPKGPKQPRSDLGVPTLRVIVEVKFMRTASFSKTVEEAAADTALYLSGDSRYDSIVAFVWDASASSHRHEELRQGLCALDGVEAAVVVSRPGTWTS